MLVLHKTSQFLLETIFIFFHTIASVTLKKSPLFYSEIDEVNACIEASLEECSDTAILEITTAFEVMVREANVTCTDGFLGCATKYTHYVLQIVKWKHENPPPEPEPESSATKDTEKSGTEKSEKTKKTDKSSKTKKTDKSEKTKKSDKSAKTKKTDKSAKTKKSDKSTKTKKTDKSAKTKKSEKSSKTKKSEKTVKSEKSVKSEKTATRETAKTPKEPAANPANLDQLVTLCGQWSKAWTCLEAEWTFLTGTKREYVTFIFTQYHAVVSQICGGTSCMFTNSYKHVFMVRRLH